jgi:DNA-directed RNA polymerase subunit RPC12/RpoP
MCALRGGHTVEGSPMNRVHVYLRCPRCGHRKTVEVTAFTRIIAAARKLPDDTRCPRCWKDGWFSVAMSIVGAKSFPCELDHWPGREAPSPLEFPALAPTSGEVA